MSHFFAEENLSSWEPTASICHQIQWHHVTFSYGYLPAEISLSFGICVTHLFSFSFYFHFHPFLPLVHVQSCVKTSNCIWIFLSANMGEGGKRSCAVFVLAGFQDPTGSVPEEHDLSQSWPCLGQGVGLEASRGPLQPELSSDPKLANERTVSEEVVGSEWRLQKDYIYFTLFKNYSLQRLWCFLKSN